jgi:hypothetical protein
MNRYLTTQLTTTSNEKRRLQTTIFPTISPNINDFIIRTTSIERLDKLAQEFYSDATAWPVIATANGLGKGTLVIPPNTTLRIPAITNIQDFLTNINSSR